jgi:hypothetical protein
MNFTAETLRRRVLKNGLARRFGYRLLPEIRAAEGAEDTENGFTAEERRCGIQDEFHRRVAEAAGFWKGSVPRFGCGLLPGLGTAEEAEGTCSSCWSGAWVEAKVYNEGRVGTGADFCDGGDV